MSFSVDTFSRFAESTPHARSSIRNIVGSIAEGRQRRSCRINAYISGDDESQQLHTEQSCKHLTPRRGWHKVPVIAASAVEVLSLAWPHGASAAETLPVEFIKGFLDNVEQLGPYGPLFFVVTLVGAEMVPLFPTQPLTIASGILFGAPKGALLAWVGASSAAMLAFLLSRRLGEKLAKKAVAGEIDETKQSGIFSRVQSAVESGSFQQQVVAVMLLRLTPVVPFSATNYLLGATPLKFPAFLVGSLAGLTVWCSIYAALGGAGRELLNGGVSVDVLFEDLLARASGYTQDAAIVMGALGILALVYYKFGRSSTLEGDEHEEGRT